MSRDPLEGIRPGDSDRPSFTTSAPASPTPAVSPISVGQPASGGGAKVIIFIAVGACVALGVAAAVFFQVDTSQGPKPSSAATSAPAAGSDNAAEPVIRQMPRHSPEGSPDTPPANDMTTIAPKGKP